MCEVQQVDWSVPHHFLEAKGVFVYFIKPLEKEAILVFPSRQDSHQTHTEVITLTALYQQSQVVDCS